MTPALNGIVHMPAEKVILTNNSALFSTLAMEHIIKQAPCTIIVDNFWLDNVHKSRLNTEWGQRKNEFPLFVQEKISQLFPDYPDHKRITFEMFKKIRNSVIKDLQKSHNVIFGQVNDIEKVNEEVQFKSSNGDILHTSKGNVIVYNTLSKYRSNDAVKNADDADFSPQTELYTYARGGSLEDLVIFGSGLSAIWIKEQCPEKNIRFIAKNEDKKREMLDTPIERNKNTEIAENEILTSDKILIYSVKNLAGSEQSKVQAYLAEHSSFNMEDLNDNDVVIFEQDKSMGNGIGHVLFVGKAYNAIGYEPKKLAHIEDINIVDLHAKGDKFYSPRNLPSGALLDRYTAQMSTRLSNQNVDIQILAVQFESLFFRESDHPIIKAYLEQNGIKINKEFFKLLEEKVKTLEDAPITSKQSVEFLTRVFEDTCDPEQAPFFRTTLMDVLGKKKNAFKNHNKKIQSELDKEVPPLMFSRKGTDIAVSDKNNGADISAKKMAKSAFGQSNDTAKKMDKPDL